MKAELSFQEMENENALKEKSCNILPQKLEFYKRELSAMQILCGDPERLQH